MGTREGSLVISISGPWIALPETGKTIRLRDFLTIKLLRVFPPKCLPKV